MSLVDGHKVLKTLQGINSLVDDGPKDEITTQVWTFTGQDAQLSEDFIQGTQDFSDTSFIRGVDFSKPQEAEQLVNSFVEKTSDEKVKSVFKDLNSTSDLLFLTSFSFQGLCLPLFLLRCWVPVNVWSTVSHCTTLQFLTVFFDSVCLGNWRTAFQPEKTSSQEFHVDETTTVMAPLMTHTGQYHYLNDKVNLSSGDAFLCSFVGSCVYFCSPHICRISEFAQILMTGLTCNIFLLLQ